MAWLSIIVSNIAMATLVAAAAWFVGQRLRRPAVARVLWVLVLIKLLTPPLVSAPIVELPVTMACALGACGCPQHAGILTVVTTALPWALLAAWSVGAAATSCAAWRRWAHFRRLIAHAAPAPPSWQALATRLAAELAIRRPPEVLSFHSALPPLVVTAWRRPKMLLPAGLLHRLNSAQRRALLLHELMHLRRGDHLVRMLELVVGVAFWWLPGIGAIGRHLRACEEACCDAAVTARLPRARRAYAQLLLDVVDFAHPLPRQLAAHATAMSAANNLEQRLRAILHDGRAARGAWPASALAMSLALVALPSGVHCVFADRPPPTAALDDGCGSPAKTLRWTGCDPPAELSAFRCPQF